MSERERFTLPDGTETEIESFRSRAGDVYWRFLPLIPRRFFETIVDDRWENREELLSRGVEPYVKAREKHEQFLALPPIERAVQEAIAGLPKGQLWQECGVRGCRAEPANLCCERCDRHCTCEQDIRERIELEAAAPGLQQKVAEYDDQAQRGIE
jgi:hypothetical protein